MATILDVYEGISKVFSKWSAEFSALITVCFALMSFGLIPKWVVETILTVAMFLFFAGMTHKLILKCYEDHIKTMKAIKKCKEVKSNGSDNT